MPVAASPRLRKLVDLMLRQYARIGVEERAELMPAAENYDTWFRTQALPAIEALLIIERGKWTEKGGPEAIPRAGRIVEEGCARYLLKPVTDWTLQHFREFWTAGHSLWRLNREMMLLPTPKRIDLRREEADQIAGYKRAEISAWQDHAIRHRRHVERMVHAACVQGWTTAQFSQNMTAPDGRVVGFRYGNADLSWREHLRRFTVGRPHMMAAAAVEWRMRHAPGGR